MVLLITVFVGVVHAMEKKITGASYYTVHRKGGVCDRYRMPGIFSACVCTDHSEKIIALLKKGLPAVSYHNQQHEIIKVEQSMGDSCHEKLDPEAKLGVGPEIEVQDAYHVYLMHQAKKGVSWLWEKVGR